MEDITVDQGKEFMNRLKNIKKNDFIECPNIITLLINSVIRNEVINYKKCTDFAAKGLKKS